VQLVDRYQASIERCEPWLAPSGGSTVPDDLELIDVIKYEPVFTWPAASVKLKKQQTRVELKMVGEGSYATVYSCVDRDCGIKFAVKRARRGIDERDLVRDFGLVKDKTSQFTRTQTEMRGTIRDPPRQLQELRRRQRDVLDRLGFSPTSSPGRSL